MHALPRLDKKGETCTIVSPERTRWDLAYFTCVCEAHRLKVQPRACYKQWFRFQFSFCARNQERNTSSLEKAISLSRGRHTSGRGWASGAVDTLCFRLGSNAMESRCCGNLELPSVSLSIGAPRFSVISRYSMRCGV
ncbi:unnamed protein product [Hapterophycus canaliculatus]